MKISMCEEMKAAKIVVDDAGSGYLTTLSVLNQCFLAVAYLGFGRRGC